MNPPQRVEPGLNPVFQCRMVVLLRSDKRRCDPRSRRAGRRPGTVRPRRLRIPSNRNPNNTSESSYERCQVWGDGVTISRISLSNQATKLTKRNASAGGVFTGKAWSSPAAIKRICHLSFAGPGCASCIKCVSNEEQMIRLEKMRNDK